MRWLKFSMASACAVILLACTGACGNSHEAAPARVTVPKGASFRMAVDSLHAGGVVKFPFFFRVYARLQGDDRRIHAGIYEFQPGTGWNDVLRALRNGESIVNRVTIPEGFTLTQIRSALAETTGIVPDSFDAAVADTALRRRLRVPDDAPTIEGYLFPDTYTFTPGTSARAIVEELVQRFEQEWAKLTPAPPPLPETPAAKIQLDRHQLMTLASIVEREAKVADERPVIAAVYYNRLAIGMPLQADPTVQYALGTHVERVLYKDLEVESPYNTYKYPGLPPGPIASPGSASMRAALQPARVSFLYFVATPDGRHEFRNTHGEHVQAIRKIRGIRSRTEK